MSEPTENPLSQRTSHIELPAGNEIMHISNAEEKRPLLPERQTIHFPDFTPILRLYEHYDIDTDIYTTEGLIPQYILDTGGAQVDALAGRILETKHPTGEEIGLFEGIYDYLAEEDEPKPSDYIFVFGAKTPLRIEKAVELYKSGLAPKLILSGRGPFYGKTTDVTEAEQYAKAALEAGVPERAMIIEDASITIPDNVRRTLNMMDTQGLPYRSFITVSSPYSQRRSWCTWKKHTPEGVDIYRVNSETGPKFTPDNWCKNEDGLKVVLGEFVKLRNTIAFNDA